MALAWDSTAIGHSTDRTIAIAKSGCAQAAEYSAAGDVAFSPGVDRQGRYVVPADLEDGDDDLIRESVTIIVSSDLEKRFGIPHDSALLAEDAVLGIVDVRLSDGRITFNGVTLSDRESQALSELCKEATGRHPPSN